MSQSSINTKVTRRAPPAPRRSGVTKMNKDAKSVSPDVVKEDAVDEDFFNSKAGSKGNLKFNDEEAESAAPLDCNLDMVDDSPIEKPKITKVGKSVRIADGQGVPRRSRAIKKKPEVEAALRKISQRVAAIKSRKAPLIEISDEDEGYRSIDVEEDVADADDNGNADDEEDSMRNFIVDDEAEEDVDDENEDDMAGDANDAPPDSSNPRSNDNDGSGEEEEEVMVEDWDSSPLPDRITTSMVLKDKKKRVQDDRSEDEAPQPAAKRRMSAQNVKRPRTGILLNNASRPTQHKQSAIKQEKPVASVKTKSKNPDLEATSVAQTKAKNQGTQEAVRKLKQSGEEDASDQKANKETRSPEERGCEVTRSEKQSDLMKGTYTHLPALKAHTFSFTNGIAFADFDVLLANDYFPGKNTEHMRHMASVRRIEGAFITNPARDDPRDFYFKPGASQVLSFKKTQAAADAVLFGIVLKSTLIEGRTYTGANGQDRRLKELEVHPDTQEGERFLAFLSMVSGRKVVTIQTSPDEACLTYSTKHTAVDGSGEEIKRITGSGVKLGARFKGKSQRAPTPSARVHADIQRQALSGTDTIPIFDSTAHFDSDQPINREEIMTQRANADPRWNDEIPIGSFVMVHSTVTTYNSKNQNQKSTLSLNLTAIHVLAVPTNNGSED